MKKLLSAFVNQIPNAIHAGRLLLCALLFAGHGSSMLAGDYDAEIVFYEQVLENATEKYESTLSNIEDTKNTISQKINSNHEVLEEQRKKFMASSSYKHEIANICKREFALYYGSLSAALQKSFGSSDLDAMKWSGDTHTLEELDAAFAKQLPVMREKYLQLLKDKHKVHKIGSYVSLKNKYGRVYKGRFRRIETGKYIAVGNNVIAYHDLDEDVVRQFDSEINEEYVLQLRDEQFPELTSEKMLRQFKQLSLHEDVNAIFLVCMNIYLRAGYIPDVEFSKWMKFDEFKTYFLKRCQDILFENYLTSHGFYYNSIHHSFFPKELRDTINYLGQLQSEAKKYKEAMHYAQLRVKFYQNVDTYLAQINSLIESWMTDMRDVKDTSRYWHPALLSFSKLYTVSNWTIKGPNRISDDYEMIIVRVAVNVHSSTKGGFPIVNDWNVSVGSSNLERWYLISCDSP